MIEFRFEVGDLASTWFAYSALQETVLSLRARTNPAGYPEQQAWRTSWESRYRELDTELLDSLIVPKGWVPDFLCPRPATARPEFEAELDVLAATPPERVRDDVLTAYRCGGRPLPPVLTAVRHNPAAVLVRITEALHAYWTRCLEPTWWARARTVLEGDIAHRGRTLAERGAQALFTELDGRISWQDGVLRVTDHDPVLRRLALSVDVAGRGLVLVPSLFCRGANTDITPGGPPLISYPARGRATMAEGLAGARPSVASSLPLPQPLAELIGAPRARLLALLDSPASTTALAHRLGVTPGAVSRHLIALTAAGLLDRTRHGRSVLYRRSHLGDSLCAVAGNRPGGSPQRP